MRPSRDGIIKMSLRRKKQLINNNKHVFGKFAEYYDLIYFDKNYEKECMFLLSVIQKNKISGKMLVDFGCGTGEHAIILSKKGYDVTGIDKSKKILSIAQKKIVERNDSIQLVHGDISTIKLKKKFDIAISMFSTLCYITNIQKFKEALKNIRIHLKTNGVLIFDYWNGNAVITQKPSIKTKKVQLRNLDITRIATPTLNLQNQTCAIEYYFKVKKKSHLIDDFKEVHTMRYYFPEEIKRHLNDAGFNKVNIISMSSKKKSVNEIFLNNWYLFVVAKKQN